MTSQPLAFTSAIRQAGALCLTRGFLCNVCWAGLGACSGIFSRRSSHGVRAARYTARDVVPVVTRGANFNADRLTAALCGLKHETDSGCRGGAQESAALAGGRRPHQSPAFTAAIRQSGAACLLGDFCFNAAARLRHVPGSYNGARAFSRAVGAAAPNPPAFVGYSARDGKQRTTDQLPAWPGDTGADFNGRNAQVDAQEGNRCNMRPELRTEVATTRSLTGTTPVSPEIDAGPSTFTAPPRTTTRMQTGNYGNGWRFFYQSRRRACVGPVPALAGLFS